jgi:hypothetical protein
MISARMFLNAAHPSSRELPAGIIIVLRFLLTEASDTCTSMSIREVNFDHCSKLNGPWRWGKNVQRTPISFLFFSLKVTACLMSESSAALSLLHMFNHSFARKLHLLKGKNLSWPCITYPGVLKEWANASEDLKNMSRCYYILFLDSFSSHISLKHKYGFISSFLGDKLYIGWSFFIMFHYFPSSFLIIQNYNVQVRRFWTMFWLCGINKDSQNKGCIK